MITPIKPERVWVCPFCNVEERTSIYVEGLFHRHGPSLPVGDRLYPLELKKEIKNG